MSAARQITDLRPHPQLEADLAWYFREADGDMGLCSNYQGMVLKLQAPRASSGRPPSGPEGRVFGAATRARRISRALEVIGKARSDTLRMAYDGNAPAELHAYHELAGLVLEEGAPVHRRSRSRRSLVQWLARLAQRAPKDAVAARWLAEVRSLAEVRLMAAARAFEGARRHR